MKTFALLRQRVWPENYLGWVYGGGCQEENVRSSIRIQGCFWVNTLCRVRHGLGNPNTKGCGRCVTTSNLSCLFSALGFLQILNNDSSISAR